MEKIEDWWGKIESLKNKLEIKTRHNSEENQKEKK